VGLIESSDLPEDRQFNDPEWTGHPKYGPLPLDRMTLRAFLQIDTAPLAEEDKRRLEKAAKRAHEEYIKSATPKDPSLQPWDKLDESLKLSNYHQVAFWEKTLREYKLGVRPLTEEDLKHDPLNLKERVGPKGIEELAQLEHGRWNIERLYYGWRYAKEKDVAQRRSPYLIPWEKIPPDIQKFDLDAIACLPKKLREVGLELYAL